jgi:hypothetical protein
LHQGAAWRRAFQYSPVLPFDSALENPYSDSPYF